ncbi:phosphonate ABC transporter, permease protein PhnE [Rubidibacter lacunae KORDI 51-2]|uniref:Phosphonate ABC transporter, permease protein PhnE n=1 Tax=Rubidibacter lacunae KORDI 51-2 TaxID=582515 RepID=U5DPC5_9CHRO|nr:phosphonate ABC transporter, permease protein PhnE [Rubidibacter lacunae]ERN42459.1 phosphonate ABC transporter, permease protein PhnE [Rubidibacter lacunae KORDI 51-2]
MRSKATPNSNNRLYSAPPRWRKPSSLVFVILVIGSAFFFHGLWISELTPLRIWQGFSRLWNFLDQAIPPNPKRLGSTIEATLETFEMALVGTVFGAVLSLPLAILAAENTTPHPIALGFTRSFITLLRVIPDLVWGLIFIIVVGLGPVAGIMALTADTMGFCGKFFAERIEEVEPGPVEALSAIGASKASIIMLAIFPTTLPSFVASTLFALESSVRSAVVLGLVGAGGIGVELSTSMQLLRYDEAFMVIIVIFGVVLLVEQISSFIRRNIIGNAYG